MAGTRRGRLRDTLAGLQEDELPRWKAELSKIPLREGYERIPPAVLQGAAPGALAELLSSYYGEDYGLQVALLAQALCRAKRGTTDVSRAAVAGAVSEDTRPTPSAGAGTEASGGAMREQDPISQPSDVTHVLRDMMLVEPREIRFSRHTLKMKQPFPSLPTPPQWLRKLMGRKGKQRQASSSTAAADHDGQKRTLGGKTRPSHPPVLQALGERPERPLQPQLQAQGIQIGSFNSMTLRALSSPAGKEEVEGTICKQTLFPSTGSAAGAAGESSPREDPSWDPWGQDKCDLCPKEEDPPEEIHPETVCGPDGKQETYRVHLPGAGSFRCSETEVGFEVRAAVTVQYKYDSWNRHLSAAEKQQWMVAGPLFDVQVDPAGAVTAVHLPHFLCLAGGEADVSQMRIAHFIDGGLTLEEPTRVRPFHAVLENPGFSPLGVLWRKIRAKCQAKVHSLALLYRALRAANTTLHLYLIPNDHSVRQAVSDHESRCPSVRVHKPSRTKPLKFGSCCAVSSSSQLEVTPEELEFCYLGPKLEQSYLEIYSRDMQEGLELRLMEKSEEEPIWKALVRPEDVTFCASSAQMQTEEHFIDQYREQLIQRVRQVNGVLDKLYKTVLDDEQYQSIRAERTDPEKMRKLYDLLPSWNRACKDQLYQVLEAKQKFLIQELKGTKTGYPGSTQGPI